MLGFKILVEQVAQKRPELSQFIWLILHGHADLFVIRHDPQPGVEQIGNTILHTAQTLLPLVLVVDRLLAHAFKKGIA